MSSEAVLRQSSVDIDPDWYVGQPETAEPETAAETPPETSPASQHVPTVLTKLQKWGDYESFGEPVWPSRFIPMKTPLSQEILAGWQLAEQPKHRLTVQDLLAAQTAAGRHVGLVLDLSNHDCLYSPDIPDDVEYLHVQLVAKELPPLEFVQTVGLAANQFWAHHSSDYIAIHCAYGFNRTGFVVCSYLIEHCGLSVDQALQSFARSRPPGVKHEKFRDELHRRYDSRNQHVPRPISCSSEADTVFVALGNSTSTNNSNTTTWCDQQAALGVQQQQQQLGASAAVQAAASTGVGAQKFSNCSQYSSSTAQQVYSCRAGPGSCCDCCGADGQCCESVASEYTADNGACVAAVATAAAAAVGRYQQAPAAAAADTADALAGMSEPGAAGSSRQRPPMPPQLVPGTSSNSSSSGAGIPQGGCLHGHSGSDGGSCSAGGVAGSPIARMPSARCYSSGSMGDNSSIGCSPDSSNIDLVITGGSTHSASSGSVLGGSPLSRASPSAASSQQQQQLLQLRASRLDRVTPTETNPAGAVGSSSRGQQQQEQQQRSIGGAVITEVAPAGTCDQHDPCGSSEGADDEDFAGSSCCDGRAQSEDVDCFDLDPCGESTHWRSRPGGSSSGGRGAGCDGSTCCMQQQQQQQQLLHASELSGLMAAVQLGQQQHQQQGQASYSSSRNSGQRQQQQQQSGLSMCTCPCHVAPASQLRAPAAAAAAAAETTAAAAAAAAGGDDGGGYSLGSQQRYSHASSDGSAFGGPGPELLDNESFGKVTSADLLQSIRGLQRRYEGS